MQVLNPYTNFSKRSGTVAPSGQSCRHIRPNELLHFLETGVRHQYAVWVGIPGDQERNPLLCFPFKKKDGLLRGCSEEIASLKTEAERGARDLGDEQVALGEPVHIACKYLLRGHAPVRLPTSFADQLTGEHFLTHRLQNPYNFLASLN